MSDRLRLDTWFAAACIALSVWLGWASLTTGHGWGDDFAGYILQARCLVEGHREDVVERHRFTIEHSSRRPGPIVYPWGAPVLLAVPYAMFGLNVFALKSVNLISYALFLMLLWRFASTHHARPISFAFLGLFALHRTLIAALNDVLSDIPFLVLCTATLMLIGRVVVQRRALISPRLDHLMLGLLIGLSFFVRLIGIVLLPTLLLTQLSVAVGRRGSGEGNAARRRGVSDTLLPYVAFGIFTGARMLCLPGDPTDILTPLYFIRPEALGPRAWHYVKLPRQFFVFFTEIGAPLLARHAYVLTLPFLAYGVWLRRRQDAHLWMFIILALITCSIWPGEQGLRYLYPALPFFLHFALVGVDGVAQKFRGRSRSALRAAVALAAAGAVLASSVPTFIGARQNLLAGRVADGGALTPEARELYAFLKQSTAPDSVVGFFKPRALSLFTGRRGINLRYGFEAGFADYVCQCHLDIPRRQLTDAVVAALASQGALRQVFTSPAFTVYRRVDSAAPGQRF